MKSPDGMWRRAKIVRSPDDPESHRFSPAEQEMAHSLLHSRRQYERSVTAFSSERQLPKSPEEVAFIGLAQMMIANERKELGLEPGFHIVNEHVRFFDSEEWERIHEGDADQKTSAGLGGGKYFQITDLATVRRSPQLPKYAHLKTALHEMRHQASFFEVQERPYRPRGQDRFLFKRGGFFSREEGTGIGLNEAVTESETQTYLKSYKADICRMFELNTDEYEEVFNLKIRPSYFQYIAVAKSFAEQTDKILHGGEAHTWDKLRRGYFSGELDALDDIKTAMGEDAFRLLMFMGNLDVFDHEWFAKALWPEEDISGVSKKDIYEGFLWALNRYVQNSPAEHTTDESNPIEDMLAQEGGREKLLKVLVSSVCDPLTQSLRRTMPRGA